jgi:hypothetical protein
MRSGELMPGTEMIDAMEHYAEMVDLMQRCIALSPTLTWLTDPTHETIILWILGLEILLHTVAVVFLMIKLAAVVGWLADTSEWLIRKGWAWSRKERT